MKGFCFLGEPEGGKRHLKIILTEPNEKGFVVVATVFTLRRPEKQDTSCILKKGDHPFIQRESVIEFKKAQVMRAFDILQKLHSGELALKEELAPAVFERVLAAAKASPGMRGTPKSMLFSKL